MRRLTSASRAPAYGIRRQCTLHTVDMGRWPAGIATKSQWSGRVLF